METIRFNKTTELRRNKKELEEKLNVKIEITGKNIKIDGPALDEYEASIILDAINFGFSAKKALLLKNPEIQFRKIPIKDFTKKKNLSEVKSRIIGTKGKTLRTIEEISGCDVILSDNTVGIIGYSEDIEPAETAIENLIRGSKQSNVYRYLEKSNKTKEEEGLGLKN